MLIVEDDLTSGNALRTLLSHRGYDVVQVGTLADAMERVDPSVHAIVLDLMLPDGDGGALLEHVRKQQLPIKVMITTGMSDTQRIDELKALSPEQLLRKPINLADLLRGLAE